LGFAPVLSNPKDSEIRPFEIGALDQNQLHGAVLSLTQIATPFCRELRRAMPFLARQRARLVLSDALLASDEAVPPPTDGPSFLVTIESQSDLWAALSFDGAAILALVQGLFGGASADEDGGEPADGGDPPDTRQSLGDSLTLAQRAMLKRLCGDIAARLVRLIEAHTGQKLNVSELASLKRGEFPELAADALAVDCRVEGIPHPWAVRLFMGADALQKLTAQQDSATKDADTGPTMAVAATRIPVTVVAELGRVTLRLSQVLGLRAGDTLRLPSAANDPVLVRVEGVAKFDAIPVISRGQVAVKIQSRHTE
jgi:flagellar motor switch/type III secretory pathway protein FliN